VLSDMNSRRQRLWERLGSKEFRDGFVAAENTNAISAQIHALREQRGWTQTDLAREADMAQARISLLESGGAENANLSTLRRIASAYDVALLVLFVPFSELLTRATPTTQQWLTPREFDRDELQSGNGWSSKFLEQIFVRSRPEFETPNIDRYLTVETTEPKSRVEELIAGAEQFQAPRINVPVEGQLQ